MTPEEYRIRRIIKTADTVMDKVHKQILDAYEVTGHQLIRYEAKKQMADAGSPSLNIEAEIAGDDNLKDSVLTKAEQYISARNSAYSIIEGCRRYATKLVDQGKDQEADLFTRFFGRVTAMTTLDDVFRWKEMARKGVEQLNSTPSRSEL